VNQRVGGRVADRLRSGHVLLLLRHRRGGHVLLLLRHRRGGHVLLLLRHRRGGIVVDRRGGWARSSRTTTSTVLGP
jgi:hypothetical protein